MLNYELLYYEAGNMRQSSVAVLGAAMWAWSTDMSAEQLTVNYIIGDRVGRAAAVKLKCFACI